MVKRKFRCSECEHIWEVAHGAPRSSFCPQCKSVNLHRAEEDRGYVRGDRKERGRGGFGGPPGKGKI